MRAVEVDFTVDASFAISDEYGRLLPMTPGQASLCRDLLAAAMHAPPPVADYGVDGQIAGINLQAMVGQETPTGQGEVEETAELVRGLAADVGASMGVTLTVVKLKVLAQLRPPWRGGRDE